MANRFWVGGNGTWDTTTTTNWSATTGGAGGASAPNSADVATFDAASGSAVVTLGENVTCNSISASVFTGTLAFESFQINLTSTTTCFVGNVALLITGTPVINLTANSSTGTRTITTGAVTEANSISFNITAGTSLVQFQSNGRTKNLNFTGFAGTFTAANGITIYGNLTLAAGMTWASTDRTHTFGGSSVQTITTNGLTIGSPIAVNGTGNALQLQDNLTIGATRTFTLTAGTLDLSVGNFTLSAGLFSSSNSNVRSITFGTGNITVTGSGTVWNTSTRTNFSYTGTPTVNISNNSATATTVTTGALTEAQALNFSYTVGTYTLTDTNSVYKNLNFTGFTGTVPNSVRTLYGNATYVAGATYTAGANVTTFAATSGIKQITTNAQTLDFPLTFNGIGGTFAFQDALTQGSTRAFTITNGTVQLKNGVTSTVGNFVTSGTTQKNLQSTLAGTQATLSQASGTVTATNLTIKDSNAIGGATWNAYVDQSNIDAGNNDGWDFGISPVVGGAEYTYTIRSFTQPRRF